LLEQREKLHIPQDERALRRLRLKVDELDRRVRSWAQDVMALLPKGLTLLEDESNILSLYLAQQRRLNLELDAQGEDETLRTLLGRILPLLGSGKDDWETTQAVHSIVATRLKSDIERACQFFCRDRNIPPVCDPAIDWRVAIRYMAQELHGIATRLNIRSEYSASPQRFELALRARDLAMEVAARRRDMLTIFAASREPRA